MIACLVYGIECIPSVCTSCRNRFRSCRRGRIDTRGRRFPIQFVDTAQQIACRNRKCLVCILARCGNRCPADCRSIFIYNKIECDLCTCITDHTGVILPRCHSQRIAPISESRQRISNRLFARFRTVFLLIRT